MVYIGLDELRFCLYLLTRTTRMFRQDNVRYLERTRLIKEVHERRTGEVGSDTFIR